MIGSGTLPRRSVVFHAHFYQPPREEPWLELVEREPGAAPWHDWNRRIEQECYRAVVAARIPAGERIARIVNTLEAISYNVGPTLADWLEREAPDTWSAMLAADRSSRARRGGHGNAIASPYHHIILPLASRRDKLTEVRWGITDFRRRFGREPAGMWLPETAVDEETLDVLAGEDIRFTILAPHQVVDPPPAGLPGKYKTASGRTIALFLYDGSLSHDVAFGPLIGSAERWAAAVLARPLPDQGPALVSLATDGETYGHHHPFGEMALAATLDRLARNPELRVENFASFLARHPADQAVELVPNTSWSCAHGIERWRADCGCRLRPDTSQAWRAPLREAFDWLAEELHRRFETEAPALLKDPWGARDNYTAIGLPSHLPVRARELLEMERNVLRMFTSCGWFFDDLGGPESTVCLRYAARALDWAGPAAAELAEELLTRLAQARSNDPGAGTGRDIYLRGLPRQPPEARVAAAHGALRELAPGRLEPVIGAWLVEPVRDGSGVAVQHRRTGRTTRAETRVERPSPAAVQVVVRLQPAGEAGSGESSDLTLGIADLPEPHAEELRRALRGELRRDVLSREEEARIAEGLVTYRRALADALVRQLPPDPGAAGDLDLGRLVRTLDLLELEGRAIPFDAQTRFYRLLTLGPTEARRPLRTLAERFGLAPGLPGDGEAR